MLWTLPLLLVALLVLPVVAAPFSRRADLLLSRVALPVFGFYVANENPRRGRQVDLMRAAYVGGTHRVYAARTLLMSAIAGVAGGILGVYGGVALLAVLEVSAEAIEAAVPPRLSFLAALAQVESLDARVLFALLFLSSATVGALAALGTYSLRWYYLEQRADARAGRIETTLPRTVAFVYALSRSGMPFTTVLSTLTENDDVYGEAAREIGIAVRDMNAFGTDMLTSLQDMASRTPSEGLEEFGENLASVLGSGQSLSEYLHHQYERFEEEAESQQEQYLELLATFAEIYVTVLVAGPLFFLTVLTVIGLVLRNTLPFLRLIGYVGLPLATVAYLVYIDSLQGGEAVTTDRDGDRESTPVGLDADGDAVAAAGAPAAATDGGYAPGHGGDAADRWRPNAERLAAYDLFAPLRRWVDDPVGQLVGVPAATLVVTVPLALLLFVLRVGPVPLSPAAAGVVDQPLVEASLLVGGGYALVYELQKRRLRETENAVPDFLARLASVNEAGVTVVKSLERVKDSDLGPLGAEVRRAWRDVEWGGDVQSALRRMQRRADTPMVDRAVTLIANSMEASGDIAPVLRIAADEAQNTRRLRRERRQEMLTYLMVIYISFFVFLGIIVALTVAFIPAIKQAGTAAVGTGGTAGATGVGPSLPSGIFSSIRDVNVDSYTLLFFHVSSIQGVCSGLVAGKLGEGDVRDGVKHAAVMLVLAYALFTVI
jgi:flagellar protein FlaJ